MCHAKSASLQWSHYNAVIYLLINTIVICRAYFFITNVQKRFTSLGLHVYSHKHGYKLYVSLNRCVLRAVILRENYQLCMCVPFVFTFPMIEIRIYLKDTHR